jgi:hypothetical protein
VEVNDRDVDRSLKLAQSRIERARFGGNFHVRLSVDQLARPQPNGGMVVHKQHPELLSEFGDRLGV